MNETTARRIRLIYGAVLGVSLVYAGICLMVACWGIYTSGGAQTYTPEKVAAAFAPIALPVYLSLVLALGGFILDLALPETAGGLKIEKNRALIRSRLLAGADLDSAEPALRASIEAEPRARKCHAVVSAVLLAVGTAAFLCYALDGSNLSSQDITGSIVRAMYRLIPCMLLPFAYSIFAAYHSRRSLDREIALLKQVKKAAAPAPLPAKPADSWVPAVRCGLLAVGAFLLIYGFFTGGWADVMTKAVNICTECVGLG